LTEEAHALGCKLFVYTVNTLEELAEMRAIGADGVFSDFPAEMLAEMRAR
jgi:glycerophosphoryl diester phosphodiesterase